MNKPHKHAEAIHAWADGAEIEYLIWGDTHWYGCSDPAWDEDIRYRVKPTTIKIGDIEMPEPLRVMPPEGTDVYWPSFGPATGGLYFESCEVGYYPRMLHHLLGIGMLHASAEACHQHCLALIELSKGD